MGKGKYDEVKTFVNPETGETVDLQVSYTEADQDQNFRKVYSNSFVSSYGVIGNKKAQILDYIIENIDRKNLFWGTYDDIAKATGIAKATVYRCVHALLVSDPPFFVRLRPGILMLNPMFVSYGRHEDRMGLLDVFVNYMPKGSHLFGNEGHTETTKNEDQKEK